MSFRATISMPCYLRPQRTRRALDCILNQTATNFEAIVIWDGCPIFQSLEHHLSKMKVKMEEKKNSLVYFNSQHYGYCGYWQTNWAIKNANGKYFLFYANDDVISTDHIEHYLSEIEGTDFDFVYFNSLVGPDRTRLSNLNRGKVGHSELVVRTDFLKKMPEHTKEYGHDWFLIANMLQAGAKQKKAGSRKITYHVMSAGKRQEIGID
jgi:glycosyltransferase involved in cell wall biosynthesis